MQPTTQSAISSKETIDPILQFLRGMVERDRMPRIATEGIPFLAPTKCEKIGKESALHRKSLKNLQDHLNKVVPNYPVYTPTTSPRQQALHMGFPMKRKASPKRTHQVAASVLKFVLKIFACMLLILYFKLLLVSFANSGKSIEGRRGIGKSEKKQNGPFWLHNLHADDFAPPNPPKFFIGGAMKCGTNEAMKLIQVHPRVNFKTCFKENNTRCSLDEYQGRKFTNGKINVWECIPGNLMKGKDGIRRFFNRLPHTDGVETINVDKSPAFLNTFEYPHLPNVVRKLMPGTKMVFTLCDPAERLVSEYYHYQRDMTVKQTFDVQFSDLGLNPPRTLGEFINIILQQSSQCQRKEKACAAVKDAYFQKGLYHQGIADWLALYEASEILILDMDADLKDNALRMVEFAGLPPHEYPWDSIQKENNAMAFKNNIYQGRSSAWDMYPEEMKMLASLYANSNKELAALIGQDFPLQWSSTRHS